MTSHPYDLVVIGSGPAGQKGAIAGAKLGKRVAIVDRAAMIGGTCLHTGTIPSKTLREAILYLTGLRQRAFYGRDYKLKQEISASDLISRVDAVRVREKEVINQQLGSNGITTVNGDARFLDANRLEVDNNGDVTELTADHTLIARGTRAERNRPHVLTLEQAIALALRDNPGINNASLDVSRSSEEFAASRTRRLPSVNVRILGTQQLTPLDFTFEKGVFGTFPGIGPVPAENTKLTTPLKPTAIFTTSVTSPCRRFTKSTWA